jgi:type IV secretion system protein VirB10
MRSGTGGIVSNNNPPLILRVVPYVQTLSPKTKLVLFVFCAAALVGMAYFTTKEQEKISGTEKPVHVAEQSDAHELAERTGKGSMSSAKKEEPLPNIEQPPAVHNGTVEPPAPPVDPRLRDEVIQLRKRKVDMAIQGLQAPLNVQVALQKPAEKASAQNVGRADRPDDDGENRRRLTGVAGEYDPAAQKDKEDFARRSGADGQWTLNASRSPGVDYELKSGTILPGIMLSGINSDLPGTLLAQVSQNVFDTASGRYLLIPQGSRLFGRYDSRVIMGQERVLIAWNRVILPDGSTLDLGSMPGADQGGYAGFTDSVDNHYMRLFGSAIIMSMITGGMAYSVDSLSNNNSNNNNNNNPSIQDEMGSALAATMGQASVNLLNRNMNIAPTLEIRPGYRFNLIVMKDIAFDTPYKPWR